MNFALSDQVIRNFSQFVHEGKVFNLLIQTEGDFLQIEGVSFQNVGVVSEDAVYHYFCFDFEGKRWTPCKFGDDNAWCFVFVHFSEGSWKQFLEKWTWFLIFSVKKEWVEVCPFIVVVEEDVQTSQLDGRLVLTQRCFFLHLPADAARLKCHFKILGWELVPDRHNQSTCLCFEIVRKNDGDFDPIVFQNLFRTFM